MNRNFFLTGFMGSGKSHWGRIWADKNDLAFFDLDHEIEADTGLKISQIFEEYGEKEFRKMERDHLRKFEDRSGFLLSCGGGTPCFHQNQEWMKLHGLVIYLKARPAYLLKRVMDEVDQRPILKKTNPSELLFFIEKKLGERSASYEEADLVLSVEELDDDSLAPYISLPKK